MTVEMQVNLATAIGTIERMARALLPGCETWDLEELVLAAHRATIERDEARAWVDRTKPRLEDALARLAAAHVESRRLEAIAKVATVFVDEQGKLMGADYALGDAPFASSEFDDLVSAVKRAGL